MSDYTRNRLLNIGRRLYPRVNDHVFLAGDFVANSCDLCGSSDRTVALTENGADLCRCSNCGLYYVSPRPSDEALARYYESYYNRSDDETAWWEFATRGKFEKAARVIDRFTPDRERILDVGCGYGFFLQVVNRMRMWSESIGIDLDPNGIGYANENNRFATVCYRRAGLGGNHGLQPGSFSAISAQALLEHETSPMAALKKMNALLKEGGVIFLSVPAEHAWVQLKRLCPFVPFRAMVPIHLYNFTKGAIARYLDKTGFVMEHVAVSVPVVHPTLSARLAVAAGKAGAQLLRTVTFGRWLSTIGGGFIVVGRKVFAEANA